MVFWGWGYIRTQNNQKFTLYWACIPAGETGKQDKSVIYVMSVGFPGGSDGKESTCNARDLGQSLSWEDPRRMAWQPTLVFLSEEFHGQRSLVDWSMGSHRVRHD